MIPLLSFPTPACGIEKCVLPSVKDQTFHIYFTSNSFFYSQTMIFIGKPFFLLTRFFPLTFKQALVAPSLKISPLDPCTSLQLLPLFSFTAESHEKCLYKCLFLHLPPHSCSSVHTQVSFLFTNSSLFLLWLPMASVLLHRILTIHLSFFLISSQQHLSKLTSLFF